MIYNILQNSCYWTHRYLEGQGNHQNNKEEYHECPGLADCHVWVWDMGGKADRSKVQAFEMWCWRKMLRISWKEHKTNEFVRCQVGGYTPLYQKIVHNKLQYFGHISRREGDCLEKIIVQGMMEGQRRRGRQKTRWTDGIKESTGLSVTAAYRIAQDRHSWNNIIKRVTTSQQWLIGQRRTHKMQRQDPILANNEWRGW